MATPKPGEIRCPTCHRSTPPAAFCTQCGSAIPPDARTRPRGMDRDELQERIRARRSGGDPYRRGSVDDTPVAYGRYEPDPTDANARRPGAADQPRTDHLDDTPEAPAAAAAAAAAAVTPPPDLTRDTDDWSAPAAVAAAAATPPPDFTPPPSDVPDAEPVVGDNVDNFDDDEYEYPYPAEEWDSGGERRSGAGAFAILGFLALGVLALLGGAMLAGIFTGDETGAIDPTPTPLPTIAATATPSVAPSVAPSGSVVPSASAAASGAPVVFPDGFEADTQPCLPGSAGIDGCDSNAVSNNGSVWVWVGFRNGTDDDVISARLTGPDGEVVGQGEIPLARIGCSPTCPGGWTYFPFSGLPAGTYVATVERNGQLAAETEFAVE